MQLNPTLSMAEARLFCRTTLAPVSKSSSKSSCYYYNKIASVGGKMKIFQAFFDI